MSCREIKTDRDFTVATIAAPRGGLGDNEEEDDAESPEETAEDSQEDKNDS